MCGRRRVAVVLVLTHLQIQHPALPQFPREAREKNEEIGRGRVVLHLYFVIKRQLRAGGLFPLLHPPPPSLSRRSATREEMNQRENEINKR